MKAFKKQKWIIMLSVLGILLFLLMLINAIGFLLLIVTMGMLCDSGNVCSAILSLFRLTPPLLVLLVSLIVICLLKLFKKAKVTDENVHS